MEDLSNELIHEGRNMIQKLTNLGYGEIVTCFSDTAMDFLENLNTLQEPVRQILSSLPNNEQATNHIATCDLETNNLATSNLTTASLAGSEPAPSHIATSNLTNSNLATSSLATSNLTTSDITTNDLATSDIPVVKFSHDTNSGWPVAKCVCTCHEWKSLLVGLFQAAFKQFDNTEINVELKPETENKSGFIIIEFIIKPKSIDYSQKEKDILCQERKELNGFTDNIPRISPASFCKVLPFHFLLDSDLTIIQIGHSLARVMRNLRLNQDKFSDRFEMISPTLPSTFETFKTWHEIPVTLHYIRNKAKREPPDKGTLSRCYSHPTKWKHPSQSGDMSLRGQMTYIRESAQVLFVGSPWVQSIDELARQGLFLSDIPLHDATRDLLLLNEQLQAESELARKLETTTSRLEETCREQEEEKQLSDNLVYSILPPTVAQRLRTGQPIEAEKYRSISILFCGICDFDSYCSTLAPMQVVDMLNDIYTRFDALADPSRGVYKMETVGDKYMLVSGLPEKNSTHARNIALAAIDMLDTAAHLRVDQQHIQVQIGVHSGEVVAGVVGQKLPHYAVFGGAVCLASRMESKAPPDTINCSSFFYGEVESTGGCHGVRFEDRGLLSIKGWTEPLNCYFLTRDTHA